MAVRIDHLALAAHDPRASAQFLADVLGLPDPRPWGPFIAVDVDETFTIDYATPPGEWPGQHVAFLVGEDEFDVVLATLQHRAVTYWADPRQRWVGQYNTHDGGRGLYFDDPGGHHFEVITRRYGSGG